MVEQRGRSGVVRRARTDVRWGHGRRLVLVDLENVSGGPCRTADAARWARRRLTDCGLVVEGDHVTVAVDGSGLAHVLWCWHDARCLPGHGPDGADLVLLDELADRVPQRYDHVVLASGDGIFTEAVAELVARGVHVVVAAHADCLSASLASAASEVVLLSTTRPVAA